jgi:peptidoglycan L-alanyl-D-glutamate endopeptidase CwlK
VPSFGRTSANRLRTCDPVLRLLFEQIVEERDCSILEGHRGEAAQTRAFESVPQRSQVRWPNGKHNQYPSQAVDVAPYPIPEWEDTEAFLIFGAFVVGFAAARGIGIRWGGDWDGDGSTRDQAFDDLVHFELLNSN